MMEIPTRRPAPLALRGRSRTADEPSAATARPAVTPILLCAWAAWFGVVGGLLELGTLLARMTWSRTVTPDLLTLNHHFGWMIPLADTVLIAAIGLILAPLVRFRPVLGGRLAVFVLALAAAMAPLLTIAALHPAAIALLACGLATTASRLIRRHVPAFRRLVPVSLPVLLVLSIGGGLLHYRSLVQREARAEAALPAAPRGAPNVLLIVLDTVRARSLSTYGYPRETSPNLTRLASRGIRFEQARAPASWTLASHASLFTGRWPNELSTSAHTGLDATYPVLAEHLRDRGYRTAGFAANTHYCNDAYGIGRGFTHYEDFPEKGIVSPLTILRTARLGLAILQAGTWLRLVEPYPPHGWMAASQLNRNALDWLARQPDDRAGRPFFLFLNYMDAHGPYLLPPGVASRYGSNRDAVAADAACQAFQRKRVGATSAEDLHRFREAAGRLRDCYDDGIAYLDAQLGLMLEDLERRGLMENTLIIVTADHGELFGEHDLMGHATTLYEAAVRVPLIIVPPRGGGDAAGRVVRTPVSLRDLPATILDLADIEAGSRPFPGRSLASTWSTEAGPGPGPVLSELDLRIRRIPGHGRSPASRGPMQALAARDAVYIRMGDGAEELYSLADDPDETHDLAGSPGSRRLLEQLRGDLDAAMRDPNDPARR